jgi:hypothetical protein
VSSPTAREIPSLVLQENGCVVSAGARRITVFEREPITWDTVLIEHLRSLLFQKSRF